MPDENQHWVPQLLIRNFVDADGRAYLLDIQTDEVKKRPPKYVASGAAFNEFTIDGERVSFEPKLGEIEGKAAPILKRIIQERNLKGLMPADRISIAEFIAVQSVRTNAFYMGFAQRTERNAFGPVFKRLLDSASLVADELAARHWALLCIESDDVFYLGDNPVVLQRTDNPKEGSGLGFDVAGVEALMPLSSKCALYMPCRATSADRIERYRAGLELHRVVRSTILRGFSGGSAQLNMAQLVIRTLDPLYRAFTEGEALVAKSENVENLNYLQCSWSHAAIYSSRKDFGFARRVFRENPQYRAVPKTSILELAALSRAS
jgi:hypothetical protein